jgi:hypothetical protein
MNGDGNCITWSGDDGYNIGQDENYNNMLTNRRGTEFTIEELEVWEVTLINE